MKGEQSLGMSAVEQVVRMALQFVCCLALQFAVFPLAGFDVTFSQALWLQVAFTGTSFFVGFGIRRLFERWRV